MNDICMCIYSVMMLRLQTAGCTDWVLMRLAHTLVSTMMVNGECLNDGFVCDDRI